MPRPRRPLAVKDPARSFRFYRDVFGVISVYRSPGFIQAQTPGSRDVIVFEKAAKRAGRKGGVAHIGFRLIDPADLEAAGRAVQDAGGKILELGMFAPGEPYLFASDPDGYVVEVWYEPPTPVDPPPGGRWPSCRGAHVRCLSISRIFSGAGVRSDSSRLWPPLVG